MIVWVVRYEKGYGCIVWPSFRECWTEFRTNDLAELIYPKWMEKSKYEALKEFAGF